MKLFVISKTKHLIPPDTILPTHETFNAYLDKYIASGHFVDTWFFAGRGGGGAIVNAETL